MTNQLISENLLEKVASLALGCCLVAGVVTVSATAAPVVASAVSLGAVLTAVGLKSLIKNKPECEKALTRVKRKLAHDLIIEGEANEMEVRQALAAFDGALQPENMFTQEALRDALANESRVVVALTAHVLADMAHQNAKFAVGAGMARDLADRILGAAFAHAVEECSPFRGRVNVALAEVTLEEVRALDQSVTGGFAGVEVNADARQLEVLKGQEGLAAQFEQSEATQAQRHFELM